MSLRCRKLAATARGRARWFRVAARHAFTNAIGEWLYKKAVVECDIAATSWGLCKIQDRRVERLRTSYNPDVLKDIIQDYKFMLQEEKLFSEANDRDINHLVKLNLAA